jgi:pimeloyl-ACP methyl ester carboxylesterase
MRAAPAANGPMREKMTQANGVEICSESFGNPSHPALLLIMGATSSMLWWPDDLCHRLAEGGRHVIRYDNRDTGRSITYPLGRPGYSLDDLSDDAAGVLDAYGIARAHIVGMSLGGTIVQLVALAHAERVSSVTIISSSVFGPEALALPGIADKLLAYNRSAATVNWSDTPAVIDFMVGGWRLVSGSGHPFDEAATRAIATREVARARSLSSMFNHALLTGGAHWHGRVGEIQAPTLIIHGTDDPVVPYVHGLALAKVIPGAKLVTLPGTGHELPRAVWDTVVGAILEHTAHS